MIQDQYRAIMQYSVSKESTGRDRVVTDWYCAKVGNLNMRKRESIQPTNLFLFYSVEFSTSNVVITALNATHLVRKAKKVAKEVMKSATS